MRRFAVVAQRAIATPDFSLVDIPGTSGRLDVLLRCIRAALLVSHGLRKDTSIDLVLTTGPRTIRIDGAAAKYIRPDERHLATLIKKVLATATEGTVREGITIANGAAIEHAGPLYVLEEGGTDVRSIRLEPDALFVLGDHLGFDEATRAALSHAQPISVGPVSLQADDVIALVHNELDRQAAAALRSSSRT